MRKSILKIYAIALAIGFVYWIWGQITGLYLSCFIRSTTGLLCPGCGISRMFLELSKGNIRSAFHYNPVVFSLLIIWNALAALCFWGKPAWIRSPKFLYTAFWVTMTILLLFGIFRNFS